MITKILSYKPLQTFLIALIILGAVFCVFTPNYLLFKLGARFAVQIMFGYLILGLGFLFFRQPRLMFTSFACCAGLCLYLKNAGNNNLIYPNPTNASIINIAHFNVSNHSSFTQEKEKVIADLLSIDTDIISFQDFNDNLVLLNELKVALQAKYPHTAESLNFSQYDLIVFSKYPIKDEAVFYYYPKPGNAKIPILRGCVQLDESKQDIYFVTTYMQPPYNENGNFFDNFKGQLDLMSEYTNSVKAPILTFGEFNDVSFSSELLDFRKRTHLKDSRIFPGLRGSPVSHIFYSNPFICVGFREIKNNNSEQFGIVGSYQLSTPL